MASLGFSTYLDKTKNKDLNSYQKVTTNTGVASQPYNPTKYSYGNDYTAVNVGQPENWQTQTNTRGTPGQPMGLGTVDRSKLPAYPTGWDPNNQPGRKYVPGKGWVEVQTGADVTWDAQTNTAYYHGTPITEGELADLYQRGPAALQQTSYLEGADVQRNLGNLGFGTSPNAVDAPQLGPLPNLPASGRISVNTQVAPPPMIQAPTITPEQGGFQDFDKLQSSLYESTYRPVERELRREQGLADEQLAARLAQAGISSSGTGVAQRAKLADDYSRQRIAAAEDAANNAAVQRYGMEYTQSMENAKLRQEANLASAGFSLQAQSENARNLLTASVTSAQLGAQVGIAQAQLDTQASVAGAQIQSQRDIAQANLYLQTMGLNFEQQNAAQQNYLQLLGIQQQDLARMDRYELESLSLFYNTYLKEVAIMVSAGQVNFGKTDSGSSSQGGNISIGF